MARDGEYPGAEQADIEQIGRLNRVIDIIERAQQFRAGLVDDGSDDIGALGQFDTFVGTLETTQTKLENDIEPIRVLYALVQAVEDAEGLVTPELHSTMPLELERAMYRLLGRTLEAAVATSAVEVEQPVQGTPYDGKPAADNAQRKREQLPAAEDAIGAHFIESYNGITLKLTNGYSTSSNAGDLLFVMLRQNSSARLTSYDIAKLLWDSVDEARLRQANSVAHSLKDILLQLGLVLVIESIPNPVPGPSKRRINSYGIDQAPNPDPADIGTPLSVKKK